LTGNGLGGSGVFAGGLAKEVSWNGTNEANGTDGGGHRRIKDVQGGIRVNQTKSNLSNKGRRQKEEGRKGADAPATVRVCQTPSDRSVGAR
jgi:hypothetical protein